MNSKNQILTLGSINFGSKIIKFTLLQLERKTLAIEVTPDMDVIVRAPLDVSYEAILDRVKKKASWIIKQINFFNDFHPKLTPRKYKSGETFLYLGRQYILKIELTENKEEIKLKGKNMIVFVSDKDNVEKTVNKWYLKNAKEKFNIYAEGILKKFENLGVRPNKLIIRSMKTRWGSCSKKGNITLNSELIKAPRGCIEYVLTHECTHLIEFGHTKRFYEIQASQMPDWEKWKNKLEKLLA
ncbi:metal-dependent hydrolase [Candidatus Gracilibacteria bacterium]|nr:MAG: metal-dependent hydrolase [Candidatus Gracilibacteria bacterium]PIE85594.1 MAG: metal-dependent hydrolase [Candidatus Gracilibacteria bacterium]